MIHALQKDLQDLQDVAGEIIPESSEHNVSIILDSVIKNSQSQEFITTTVEPRAKLKEVFR